MVITMALDIGKRESDNGHMNWKKLIQDLMDAGVTQAVIADKCGTSQGYISGLYRGDRKSPNYELGSKLVALHSIEARVSA